MKKALPYKISIEKVQNGYILSYYEEIEDDVYKKYKQVFSDEDDGEDEALVELLRTVSGHFGIFHSKHNDKNLKIEYK